jgi:hypothetical protein
MKIGEIFSTVGKKLARHYLKVLPVCIGTSHRSQILQRQMEGDKSQSEVSLWLKQETLSEKSLKQKSRHHAVPVRNGTNKIHGLKFFPSMC